MSLTGTISWSGGSITLAQLAKSEGVYTTYFLPLAPEQQLFKHPIPGVQGQIVAVGKPTVQRLHIGVVYYAIDCATAIKNALLDFDAMATALDCTVSICGVTWHRCHFRQGTPLRPARRVSSSLASAHFELVFDCDNGGYT